MRTFGRAALLLTALPVIIHAAIQPSIPPAALEEVTRKLELYGSRLAGVGFSGAILVAKDGKFLLARGYGMADRQRKIPNTEQTIFQVGSITKQFTAAGILKLEMAGKLSTADPILEVLSDRPAGQSLDHHPPLADAQRWNPRRVRR